MRSKGSAFLPETSPIASKDAAVSSPDTSAQSSSVPADRLARGPWQAPAWGIALLGGTVVVSGALYFARRARNARSSGPR